MRKSIFLLIIMTICTSIYAQRNWKIYTNTTHIYDMAEIDNQLKFATWGGLLSYDLVSDQFISIETIIDGYSSNDISCLDYNDLSGILSIGTKKNGIDRTLDNDFIMPVSEILGLASNSVNKMVHADSLLIVATKNGLSVFGEYSGFPFPFLVNNFNIENGLSDNNITSLAITDNQYIVCGSIAGIDYIHIDSLSYQNSWNHLNSENSLLPSSYVNSISARGNNVLIGCDAGMVRIDFPDLSDWDIFDSSYFGEVESIYPVYLDDDNSIWFSYGIWNDDNIAITDSSDIAITHILPDGQVRKWSKLDLPVETTDIMKFSKLDDGRLVALTWGEGFLIQNDDNWDSKKTNSIIASLIKDIKVDHDGKLWASNGYLPPPSNPLLPKGTAGISCFDGELWTNFSSKSSPLHSDNIYSLEIDSQNRVWMGAWYIRSENPYGWVDGIAVLDQTTMEWDYLTTHDGIRNNAISYLTEDDNEQMWVCSYGGSTGGISVLDINTFDVIEDFELHESTDNQNDPLYILNCENKTLFGGFYSGVRIWDDDSIPYDNGPYWKFPPSTELISDQIYAFARRIDNGKEEIWVASANGLYSYSWSNYFDLNGEYLWSKYGTIIKKKSWHQNEWYDEATPEFWYIEGQERLYGSYPTFPTALFVDPFDRVWIGTAENGITVYDVDRDIFTNINMSNSPLISNKITAFAYDEFTGVLYIGTSEGLNSVEIGISEVNNMETELNDVIVFPNPFNPETGEILRIENKDKLTMPKGDTKCYIYDLAGERVIELEKNTFEQFSWDGNNIDGMKCSSGIYLFVITSPDGNSTRGKIALIR